jgi:DNA-binding transcriptional ArsR family regulator
VTRDKRPLLAEPLVSGKFAYSGLDRVIHEKARLGIMTSLVSRPEGLAFNDLKELCELTDGNLNRHLEVLHEAGLVEIRKERGSRRTRTICKVTSLGRQQFLDYIAELEHVVAEATQAAKAASKGAYRRLSPA